MSEFKQATSRRNFLKVGAAGTVAAGAAVFGAASASAIGEPNSFASPKHGDPIRFDYRADGTVLRIHGQETEVNLAGHMLYRADFSDSTDSSWLRLVMLEHHARAEHRTPGLELGQITLAQGDALSSPDSLLDLQNTFPPELHQTMFLNFTMMIENPPRQARAARPLVLSTKAPGVLVGQLSRFPPEGAVFHLRNPIELVVPGEQDVVATLERFPVTVHGR